MKIMSAISSGSGPMIPLRGLFLIDKNGVVQHQVVNFFTLIRNVEHVLSTIEIRYIILKQMVNFAK